MKTSKCSYRLFLISFSISVIPILLLISAFNFIVDPDAVFNTINWEGFNKKMEIDYSCCVQRSLQIIRHKPQAILLGSSRVQCGFDEQDLTALIKIPSYNAGIPGSYFEIVYHYFKHAIYNQPNLKNVVIGLDLFMFTKNRKCHPEFSIARLNKARLCLDDFCNLLLSFNHFQKSLSIVFKNAFDINLIKKNEPTDPDAFSRWWIEHIFKKDEPYALWKSCSYQINLFRDLVQECNLRNIDLKVFFAPPQAIYWEGLYLHGLWPKLEQLKRDLCHIYPIWDFSGINCITTREVEQSNCPLYLEYSHFNPCVGKIILNKIYGVDDPYPSFGVLLTPNNIEESLDYSRALIIERVNSYAPDSKNP